jgi:DNA-binding SARP family transcriptional activator
MAALTLALLGRFESSLDGQPLVKFRTSRVQALLAYLSTEFALGASRQQREVLMELLWPGMPPDSARTNLRQNLYYLRQTIPDLATADGEEAVPFLLAIELYRDDFLADFYLPDSSPFEEWAAARRSAFRRQTLDALDALASSAVQQGQLKTAEGYARRQLEIDPIGEGAYRTLMRVLTWTGRQGEALVLYEECVRLLQDELGSPPSEATIALAETIKEGKLAAPAEAIVAEQGEVYSPPVSGDAAPSPAEPESDHDGDGGEPAGGRLTRPTRIGLVVLAALMLVAAAVAIANFDSLNSPRTPYQRSLTWPAQRLR